MEYVEFVDGAWRATDIPEPDRHQAFEVGQKVRTDYGKGHIQQFVRGKPGWAKPRYYWVQLQNQIHRHLFAEHELRQFYFNGGRPCVTHE